jgi:hypothetical protein
MPDRQTTFYHTALMRWDGEGGAGSDGPETRRTLEEDEIHPSLDDRARRQTRQAVRAPSHKPTPSAIPTPD